MRLAPLLVLLVLSPAARTQEFDLVSRTELLFAGGGMSYIGDLNDQSAFGDLHGGGSAGFRTRLDNRWSMRAMVSFGQVSAMQDCNEQRNLSFKSALTEASLTVEFDFRPYGPGATESFWTPYLFGGVAAFHFNPRAMTVMPDGSEQWVDLQPLRTEGQGTSLYPDRRPYALTQMSMPFGVGVRLRLGKHVSMTAEYGFRKTWTDYLDDVSTTYVGAELLRTVVTDGAMAARMADRSSVPNAVGIKRGDDSLDDWYSYFNLSLGVNLNLLLGWMRSKKCRN